MKGDNCNSEMLQKSQKQTQQSIRFIKSHFDPQNIILTSFQITFQKQFRQGINMQGTPF
jgi:uncharacterized membrane protein YadS